MSQPKVLITGSNGFLGQELRKVLSQHNCFVIATGIGADRSKYQSDVYVEMDVTSSEQCKSVLYNYMPSVIINAAAMTNVDNCERNQKKCYEVNLNSVNNLLPYLKEHQPHFIQISTDFIFNGSKGWYLEEDEP
ncbi:sugar nucleotide-binding protein, partial [Flavobacteriales bacterium]|nr:sugar nucleotide-binding protein [Flavobacteriales bacterium]